VPIDPGEGETIEVGPGGNIEHEGDAEIHPGGTIEIDDGGQLTVDGSFKEDPGGNLLITVGGPLCPDSGKLSVHGHATLEGILTLASVNNFHPSSGNHYTILVAAGGLSGMFSQVVDRLNTSGLTRADIYAPNGFAVAYLPPGHGDVTLHSAVPIPLQSICDINEVLMSALAPNAEQLSAPFDIWFQLAQTQRFNLEARLDEIMAGSTGFVSNVNYPTTSKEGKELVGKDLKEPAPSPLQPAPENRWGVWVTGYGDFVNVDDDGLAKGYRYTTGGMTVGIDYRVMDHFVVGLMGGYAHTWTDLRPGSVDVDTGWGGVYAGYFNHGFYVLAAAYGGGNSLDTSRASVFGGRSNGSADSQEFSTFGTTGYDFHVGQLTFGPVISLQYSNINVNGYSEHGFEGLRVNEDSEESLRSNLGARAWYSFQFHSITVRPFVKAAWQHEYKQSRLPVTAELTDFPGPVTVYGPSLGHDSVIVNAGASLQLTPTVSTYVSYDGQHGRDHFGSNGVSGGFQISF
jgi:outer membrane autotransporter protein